MATARKPKVTTEISGRLYFRKQPRFHCDMELEVRIAGFSEFIPVTMKNISMGGMFCEVPRENLPKEGHVLEFRIENSAEGPASEGMVGLGMIKWVRPQDLQSQHSGVGIEFKTLPIETARFIRDAINKAKKNGEVP